MLELSYNQPNAVAHEVVRILHRCFEQSKDPDEITNDENYTDLRALLRECLYSTRLPVVLKYLDEEGYNAIHMEDATTANGRRNAFLYFSISHIHTAHITL